MLSEELQRFGKNFQPNPIRAELIRDAQMQWSNERATSQILLVMHVFSVRRGVDPRKKERRSKTESWTAESKGCVKSLKMVRIKLWLMDTSEDVMDITAFAENAKTD